MNKEQRKYENYLQALRKQVEKLPTKIWEYSDVEDNSRVRGTSPSDPLPTFHNFSPSSFCSSNPHIPLSIAQRIRDLSSISKSSSPSMIE